MKSMLFAATFSLGLAAAATALAQTMPDMQGMDHSGHSMPAQTPAPPQSPQPTAEPAPPTMDHGAMAGHNMDSADGEGQMTMSGALGEYSMNREASGTAWQPDASVPMAAMTMHGAWMVMTHATLNGVYDWQGGPRGDRRAFVSGMVMAMAQRSFANGDTLQFRAMLSPDPLMGPRGYPLLLASGENADGVTQLVDRQHPHDLFMELSASYSHRLSASASAFVYAGLPGEPAFGPPAFMHRQSIMDSPEAPISHHWLDSTHITFGVVTAGLIVGDWKAEISRFHGREPDRHRWDIETGALDSTAARLSWNPNANLSLQASWAHVISPEELEPDADQTRLSASAIYTVPLGDQGWWSTTLAWGRRTSEGTGLNAFAFESAAQPWRNWTFFGRAERTENNELVSVGGHHGPTFTVSKASIGVIRDWRISSNVLFGVGGLYSYNFIPPGLDSTYGGDQSGAMGFIRIKIQ